MSNEGSMSGRHRSQASLGEPLGITASFATAESMLDRASKRDAVRRRACSSVRAAADREATSLRATGRRSRACSRFVSVLTAQYVLQASEQAARA